MQIIFGKENAEALMERYTVLELEELPVDGHGVLQAYCVIPAEKIGLENLPQIENWATLHQDFLNGYKSKQYDYCIQCIDHLMDKFGGEMNSFYEEILGRINRELNNDSSAV